MSEKACFALAYKMFFVSCVQFEGSRDASLQKNEDLGRKKFLLSSTCIYFEQF